MWVSLLLKYWQIGLIVLVVSLEFGSLTACNHEHNLLIKERLVHKQDISNFKNAQAVADANAQAIRLTLQKESKANADQADAKYSSLLSEYRANLLRYKADQSGPKQSSDHQLPAPEGGNGPGTGAEISITLDDAQVCAVNTARLQAVHDWAVGLPR